ncbi:hypothetical protein [Sphingomonas sp. 3-13AW]|uniref:hypothetical protein n=1 Tax=Sphingomonas sp. 3-13AW TaxID=3050450 RepID=UPI003BB7F3AB
MGFDVLRENVYCQVNVEARLFDPQRQAAPPSEKVDARSASAAFSHPHIPSIVCTDLLGAAPCLWLTLLFPIFLLAGRPPWRNTVPILKPMESAKEYTVKKLSEIMAEKSLKKELRRAEAEARKIEQDAGLLIDRLSRLPVRVPAYAIEQMIRAFASPEGRQQLRTKIAKSQVRLLDSIENKIDDVWLGSAADLLKAIPQEDLRDVRFITAKQWFELAAGVGMRQLDLFNVLTLVYVFGGNVTEAAQPVAAA